jgi:hypothetical protein
LRYLIFQQYVPREVRMRVTRALWFVWVWVALSGAVPTLARADSSVVVLGVRSLDGDDAFAHDVSVALRAGAQKMAGWNVSQRDVSLAQMSLAHGCEEPDARCMADIAGTLEVDRLIYGTVLKTGEEVQLSLFNFDAVTGQVVSSLEQKLHAPELAEPAIEATMGTLVRRLAGEKVAGMLRVSGDTPGARVLLDGRPAGSLDLRGELLIAEVPAGNHTLSIESADTRKEESVLVEEGVTSSMRISLRPAGGGERRAAGGAPADEPESEAGPAKPWRRIFGWTSVGLAGGLVAATVVTWVRIDAINKEPELKTYRNQFPPPDEKGGVSDVCREARDHKLANDNPGDAEKAALEASARDLCGKADTLEVLQYVFLGGAVVAGGVGAYLLLTAPDDPGPVSLRPRFGPGRASLTATYRF